MVAAVIGSQLMMAGQDGDMCYTQHVVDGAQVHKKCGISVDQCGFAKSSYCHQRVLRWVVVELVIRQAKLGSPLRRRMAVQVLIVCEVGATCSSALLPFCIIYFRWTCHNVSLDQKPQPGTHTAASANVRCIGVNGCTETDDVV